MKRSLLLLLCTISFWPVSRCEENGRARAIFQPGETLRYKVKWTFLRLGTITLWTEKDTTSTDGSDFKVVLKVESNPDLRFIWIQEINESHVDAAEISTRHFVARHRNGDDLLEIRQRYDPATRTAFASMVDMNTGRELGSDTIQHAPPFVDGPALLCRARALSRSRGTFHLPTMVSGRIQNTTLDFDSAIENLETDAWGKEIRTRRYSGHADWTGATTSGLGGDFTGWVSDDDAAVPIRAEMKILIGSIVLELEEWTRPGWVPPSGATMAEGKTP